MKLLKNRVGNLPYYALGIGEPSPLVSLQGGLEPGFPWDIAGGLLSRCCQFYLLQHFPHRGGGEVAPAHSRSLVKTVECGVRASQSCQH